MRNFGVKLWSKDFIKNLEFTDQSIRAVKDGYFDYVELFVLPDSYNDLHSIIQSQLKDIKVIIHAPHSSFGMDTGDKNRFIQNSLDLKASQQFADILQSEIIILHPGFNEEETYVNESIRQFRLFNDSRIAVENMPSYCSSTNRSLHGSSPQQIKRFINEVGCKFCLDFSHAICASNAYQRDKFSDLQEYQALNPCMYHMCDGDWEGDEDKHLHYGQGNYPLVALLNNYTNSNTFITMETGTSLPTIIQPWIDDIKYLKSCLVK